MTRRTNFKKWTVLKNKDDYLLSLKQLHEWGIEPYVKLWNAIQGRDTNTSYWLSRKQIATAQNILLGYFALTKSADYAREWDPASLKYFKNLLLNNWDRTYINKAYSDNKFRLVWDIKKEIIGKEGFAEHSHPFIFNEEDFLIGHAQEKDENMYISPFDFLCKIGFFKVLDYTITGNARFTFNDDIWDYSNKICHHIFETHYYKSSMKQKFSYFPIVQDKYEETVWV